MAKSEYQRGLEDAAAAICGHCFRGVELIQCADGSYLHQQRERDGQVRQYGCNAQAIIPFIESERKFGPAAESN